MNDILLNGINKIINLYDAGFDANECFIILKIFIETIKSGNPGNIKKQYDTIMSMSIN